MHDKHTTFYDHKDLYVQCIWYIPPLPYSEVWLCMWFCSSLTLHIFSVAMTATTSIQQLLCSPMHCASKVQEFTQKLHHIKRGAKKFTRMMAQGVRQLYVSKKAFFFASYVTEQNLYWIADIVIDILTLF